MESEITAEIKSMLLTGSFATTRTRESGEYINGLICPACGKQEAWAYADRPYSINCNRKGKCGAHTGTIKLFGIHTQVEKRYPPTEQDRHRPARAFLESRGIPGEVIDRVKFEYWQNVRNLCGAVMFLVGNDEDGRILYNGRLFNPPEGEGKTHNVGPVSGHFWRMGKKYDPEQPVYVTEGIIDALSLVAMGQQAIAVLGAGYEPAKFNLADFGNIVLAFDRDKAGTTATKKWLAHLLDNDLEGAQYTVSAIMPEKGDWNDFLCRYPSPGKAKEAFEAKIAAFRLQANLKLAKTAQEYAEIYAEGNNGFAPGLFEFNDYYYWSWVKEQMVYADLVGRFTVEVMHFRKSALNEDLPVFNYRLRVQPGHGGHSVEVTATGNDLKSPDALTGFLLRHARVLWKGTMEPTRAFTEMILRSKAPEIRRVDHLGYDHRTGAYILKDVGVDAAGKILLPDKEGFFNVGRGQCLQPFSIETLRPSGKIEVRDIYRLLVNAWGDHAGVALAFLAASLFVNQVKPVLKFFPFLSLCGDPATGKSRLLMTLNAMQCLDEEGIPMSGANTKKGELRAVAQVSGMMKGLIEGNNPGKYRFDFDSILPLYNYGNSLQIRADYSNDNSIVKMPFYGSMIFVQNVEPFRERAAKERVISLHFDKKNLNEETKAAFDELVKIPLSELAGFLPALLQHRQMIESKWLEMHQATKAELKITDNRICENHALILGFHRLLCQCFDIEHDLFWHFVTIGNDKVDSCQSRQYSVADYFFDALKVLPPEITGVGEDHRFIQVKDPFLHIKEGKLFVSRPGAERALRDNGMVLDYPEKLGASLQEHPAFLEAGKNHRFPGRDKGPIKAMVFDLERLGWDSSLTEESE